MTWIDRQDQLDELLTRVSGEEVVALDTEADSLHSYFDKVCLVQMTAAGEDYVIDPLADIDLAGLGQLLSRDGVRKILHGADYDLRILQRDFGFRIRNLTDTMVSAQLLGYDAFGLAALLKRHFSVDVDKSHQRADWAMRPLTPEMLRYASLDTHYLITLADRLRAELETLGRWEWAREEFSRLENIKWEASEPDPDAFRKLKGSSKLEPRQLAALSLLFQWRDRTARSGDRPPFKVLGNEAMIEIATRLPRERGELFAIRGFANYHQQRYGREVFQLVQDALAMDESGLPQRTEAKSWMRDRGLEKRVDRLKAVRDRIAKDLKLEPSILAPRHVLAAIATLEPTSPDELAAIPSMRQWQREVAGVALVETLSRPV